MTIEGLRKSVKTVGKLLPCIENQDHKALDGSHRKALDPNWPTITVQTKNRFEEIQVRLTAHYRRRVPQDETRALIVEAAQELERSGVKKEHVCAKLIESLPYNPNYIRSLLPFEYKAWTKVEAGRARGVQMSEQNVTDSEVLAAEEKARSAPEKCYGCHVEFRMDQLKHLPFDGHPYCAGCFNKASNAYKRENRKPEKVEPESEPIASANLASVELKKHDDQFREEFFKELADEGLTFERGVKLPVLETEPGGLWRDVNLLVYLEGSKDQREEKIRDLYKRLHPEVEIYPLQFKGKGDKEKARLKRLVHKKYEFLKRKQTERKPQK